MTELITSSGLKILYYANPKELPAGRFKDFQKYMFEDWGVGSDMNAVDSRLATAFTLIGSDMKDKALQELYNLRLTFNFIIEKLSVKSYAFAVLIGSIDGESQTDYSENSLTRIVNRIGDQITQQEMETVIEAVKKNLKAH